MNGELQTIEPCDVRHQPSAEPTGADRTALFSSLINVPAWANFPICGSAEWDTNEFEWPETNTAD